MPVPIRSALAFLLVALAVAAEVQAEKKTVCTITVNSPDEKQIFRRSLSTDDYDFVELVERGRPDWLGSACRAGVRCDALVISGHFDGGDEFYSDRPDVREYLAVDEMERASCSASCAGLFSQLKEVYLFGCNTLNGETQNVAGAEIARSLQRSGYSAAETDRMMRLLNERYGDSNRDRMRQIFVNVPVIYGFSSKAPLGSTAGPLLERYFQSAGGAAGTAPAIGSGRADAKLVALFARSSMTVAGGLTDQEPQADLRRDACRFADDGAAVATKLEYAHEVLRRDVAEVRMSLPMLEKYFASVDEAERRTPAAAQSLARITADHPTRERYLAFARDADEPAVRARMLKLAQAVGWLTTSELRAELVGMMRDRLVKRSVGAADIELFCSLNHDGALDAHLITLPAGDPSVAHAAVRACLGSTKSRARVLRALTDIDDDALEIAQVYLRHHPADAVELRTLTADIAKMKNGEAQTRALDTLARYQLADRASVETLARLFPLTRSLAVQRAIAGVLLRADSSAIEKPELVRALRQHRLKSPTGQDSIDVLIRRLES